MIRHQAVRAHLNAEVFYFFKLYGVSEVVLNVFIRRKDDLPIVSALNDVMSDAGNEPRPSWHGLFRLNIDRQLKMPVGVRKIIGSPHHHYIHYTNLANRSCTTSAAQEPHSDEAHQFGSSDGQSGTDPRSFCD